MIEMDIQHLTTSELVIAARRFLSPSAPKWDYFHDPKKPFKKYAFSVQDVLKEMADRLEKAEAEKRQRNTLPAKRKDSASKGLTYEPKSPGHRVQLEGHDYNSISSWESQRTGRWSETLQVTQDTGAPHNYDLKITDIESCGLGAKQVNALITTKCGGYKRRIKIFESITPDSIDRGGPLKVVKQGGKLDIFVEAGLLTEDEAKKARVCLDALLYQKHLQKPSTKKGK